MNNITYKRGADLTLEMVDEFRLYLRPDGYLGFPRFLAGVQKKVAKYGAVTCIASLSEPETGNVIQRQYYLGGDESCPVYELNACMCGVESL